MNKKLKKVKDLLVAGCKDPIKKCSICKCTYLGWGNNAWPVNDGRCCDDCNNLVIAQRLKDYFIKVRVIKDK